MRPAVHLTLRLSCKEIKSKFGEVLTTLAGAMPVAIAPDRFSVR